MVPRLIMDAEDGGIGSTTCNIHVNYNTSMYMIRGFGCAPHISLKGMNASKVLKKEFEKECPFDVCLNHLAMYKTAFSLFISLPMFSFLVASSPLL